MNGSARTIKIVWNTIYKICKMHTILNILNYCKMNWSAEQEIILNILTS